MAEMINTLLGFMKKGNEPVSNGLATGLINTVVGPPKDGAARAAGTTLNCVLVIGALFAICWQPKFWAPACLWAAGCCMVGMLLGFLFGIPRFLARSGTTVTDTDTSNRVTAPQSGDGSNTGNTAPQSGDGSNTGNTAPQSGDGSNTGNTAPQSGDGSNTGNTASQSGDGSNTGNTASQSGDGSNRQGRSSQSGVNTNLEEISDWLTKIIVGVSLVELQKAESKLQEAAGFIAQSLGGPSQISFAYGLMAYFSIAGFLGSYLLTRLYLQKAFQEAANQP